jgi:hypothetical protein
MNRNSDIDYNLPYKIVLIILAIGIVLQLPNLHEKHTTEVEVREINATPFDFYGIAYDSSSILPKEKLHRKYRFVFISRGPQEIDHKKYLRLHPKDALEKYMQDENSYTFEVFSDYPPDPKFFEVKEGEH